MKKATLYSNQQFENDKKAEKIAEFFVDENGTAQLSSVSDDPRYTGTTERLKRVFNNGSLHQMSNGQDIKTSQGEDFLDALRELYNNTYTTIVDESDKA